MKIPKMYVGATGIGKTQKIKQQYGYVEVLLLSSMTEEDISGIPYREGDFEKRAIPPFVARLQQASLKNQKVCLLLDEMDKARREVSDTLLTLVTNQELFGIPESVDVIACANPPEWGGGDGVSIPMMNRFTIINAVPDVVGFISFITNKYGHLDNDFIQSFVDRIKNREIPLLERIGEDFELRTTSPRSLEMAISASLDKALKTDEKKEIIKGLLTTNAASGMISLFKSNANKGEGGVDIQAISRSVGGRALQKPLRFD
jgi:hypothetical protein